KEGFLHISDVASYRVRRIEDVLKVGQELNVKYLGIDSRTGKYRVSYRAALNGGDASSEGRERKGTSISRPRHSTPRDSSIRRHT
ncbi:MAG: S1 RNA-binding domain-containing protein, partial [Bacteroidia bacterium]|nr:S1 RNA-binding domain-containing protein [Bacteroidia bacterium]MDW8135152.1 S1 RNA-binding domain-containing protein [Bacteroidia bacterium]